MGFEVKYLLLFLLISGCGLFQRDESDKEESTPDVRTDYQFVKDRLNEKFLSNGFVVSRQDGNPEHQGEAILWTGVAVSSMSCDDGQALADRLMQILIDHNGGLVRYEPLGEYENGREITFDGAIGFYHAVAYRVSNCSDDWRDAWQIHLDYLDANDGKLNANAREFNKLTGEFPLIRDAISHRLGLRARPHKDRVALLETQITAWAAGVVAKKAPAYPLNLSLLTLQGLEYLGYQVHGVSFCSVSKPAKIPDLPMGVPISER
jgi:hypothetical protein